MSAEYIVVHRIDTWSPLDKHIPLHLTVLHWFLSDMSRSEIEAQFIQTTQRLQPAITHATKEDLFGPDHDIPVMRIERTPELLTLHLALETMTRQLGAVLTEKWVGTQNWNPHVTHQSEARLQTGDEVHITDLDLITKQADGMRKMLARVELRSV